jgi:hypothetical protein
MAVSADNYWLVRRNPAGGFSPVMGFDSDDGKPEVWASTPVFDTPEAALASVQGEYAEYGHSIDPECYEAPATDRPSVVTRLRHAGALVRQDADADPLLRAVGDWLDAEALTQQTMVEMIDLLNAVVTTQTGRQAPIRLGRDEDGNPAMHSDTNEHALAVADLIEARYRTT